MKLHPEWLNEPWRSMYAFFTRDMKIEYFLNTDILNEHDNDENKQEIERLYFGRDK
jgi:hypothetical protein